MEFFLNVSLNSVNSVTKIFVITVKGLEPDTSCLRDQDATTVPERHIWETESLNRAKFILQRFIRFPEFAEFTGFNESSAPFRKKIVTEVFVKAEVLKPYSLGQTCSSLLSLTRVFVALEVRSTIAGSNQGDSHRSRAVLLLSHRTTACCPNRSIPSR